MVKIGAIIEARMNSNRLPGKILKKIGNKPSILHTVDRLKLTKNINEIIIATTTNRKDDLLVDLCKKKKIKYFRGSENNVLYRVLKAAKKNDIDIIVEITGDSVFMDYKLIDSAISLFLKNNYDFVANCVKKPMYIAGFDVRIFKTNKLSEIKNKIKDKSDLEHVSSYFWRNPKSFKIKHIHAPKKYDSSKYFLGLDTNEDLKLLRNIYKSLGQNDRYFDIREIVEFLNKNRKLGLVNANINRNVV